MRRTLPIALALTLSPALASANINIEFDYTYSSSFIGAIQKDILESAASVFESRITDTLGAITSGGGTQFHPKFFNPSVENAEVNLTNQSFAQNELRIYVGAYDLGGSTLGEGGPGGYGATGNQTYFDTLMRGQTGSPNHDFGPWGGALSFNSSYGSWYFDTDTSTTETFSGADVYSVAIHEIAHILGFGTADSWDFHVSANTHDFNGVYTGTQDLYVDNAHWAEGLTRTINGSGSFETAMDPTITLGTRKTMTDLDWKALQDIGWQIAPVVAVPEPEAWVFLLAGLGLVSLASVRNRRN